jgi:hypothetical protein
LINYDTIIPEINAKNKGFIYEIFKGIAKHREAVSAQERGARTARTLSAEGHLAAQSGGMSAMHKKEVHWDGAVFSKGKQKGVNLNPWQIKRKWILRGRRMRSSDHTKKR